MGVCRLHTWGKNVALSHNYPKNDPTCWTAHCHIHLRVTTADAKLLHASNSHKTGSCTPHSHTTSGVVGAETGAQGVTTINSDSAAEWLPRFQPQRQPGGLDRPQ